MDKPVDEFQIKSLAWASRVLQKMKQKGVRTLQQECPACRTAGAVRFELHEPNDALTARCGVSSCDFSVEG